MRKFLIKPVAISIAAITMFSCSSKDDDLSGAHPQDLLKLPYSTLSIADQKKKLSAEGESTINLVKDFSNEKSAILLSSFNKKANALYELLNAQPQRSNINRAVVQLANYHGEYIWDAKTSMWTKSEKEVTDKLVALFPADFKSTTNNGKIEVKALSKTVIQGNEIPTNVVAELFVADTKEGEISAVATGVNESTFAETARIDVKLGAYKLEVDADKKGSKNTAKGEVAKNAQSIFSFYSDLAANISQQMIDSEDISSVGDGNASLTISNDLAAAGYVDGKSLLPELKRLDDAQESLWDEYYTGKINAGEAEKQQLELDKSRVNAINKFSNLALVSTVERFKVAKISVELEIEEDPRVGYIYKRDENGNIIWDDYETYEYVEYYTEEIFVLHFDDKTTVEASVFFGEGFDKLVKMWEDLVVTFE